MPDTILGQLGFGIAAASFAAFAALALTRRADRLAARLFIGVLAAQALWALALAIAAGTGDRPLATLAAPLLESLRVLAWIVFLLALGRRDARSPWHGGLLLAIAIGLPALPIVADWNGWPLWTVHASRIASVALALLVLEHLYRSAEPAQRWAFKYLAIAVTCVLGFDLLMYADALLGEQGIDPVWRASQGFANALAVPLIAVAASRNPAWQLDIAISRRMVFHSATLLVSATCTLVVAIGAYYLRSLGHDWSAVAQTVLLFATALLLPVAVMSESVRASIRVFVSKHFFDYRYDYREEWLRLTRLLSEAGHASSRSLAERGIEGIGSLVESRGGALWIRDGKRYELAGQVGRAGMEPGSLPAGMPLLDWLVTRRWIVDLNEWRAAPGRYPGLSIEAPLDDSRGWLIVPMIIHDELAGLVVLDRPRARIELDWEVRDVLKVAAAQVASFLGVQRATERLAQSEQFASFNRMSTFIVHDLKNLVAQLSLMSANAQRHRHDPAFVDDMLGTVDTVAGRMQAILAGLRTPLREASSPEIISIGELLRASVRERSAYRPAPELATDPGTGPALVHADRARLERVIGHLVQNAIEASTGVDGARVTVSWRHEDASVRITVIDTGRGMSAEFIRERLFRPFVSTKSQGMGIGLFECREYVRELGGSLAVESSPNRGTRFTVVLPLVEAPSPGVING
ncbi:MAG: XrtA/PEP-CTERM system histidine kinase PrsK [Burkholderiaceae bacterium]